MNLIYTISSPSFKLLFKMMVDTIKRYNDVDICCICPIDFDAPIKNCKYFHIDNFDFRYTSKFVINQWEEAEKYNNFLFLDNDILCQNAITSLFDIVKSNPHFMHGVTEFQGFGEVPTHNIPYFRIFDNILNKESGAYNAGTFAFNKYIFPLLKEYLDFTRMHKEKAICDQPLFNEFFIDRNAVTPSLNQFVELLLDTGEAKDSNKPLLHYNGYYGEARPKLERMINKYNRIMQS